MDLCALAFDWECSLRAGGKSPSTIRSYRDAARTLVAHLGPSVETLTRRHLEGWLSWQLESGAARTSVKARFAALQQWFKWMIREGELKESPLQDLRAPRLQEKTVPVVSSGALFRLLRNCSGPSFNDKRDAAIFRLLLDTGLRASELVGLKVFDVDRREQTLTVLGKGNRLRVVPYGSRAAEALNRYLRARAKHRKADTEPLWLSHIATLSYAGLQRMLYRRCDAAGIPRLHAHQFRHTFAHEWLKNGGSEGDLMEIGGWHDRAMLDRYGRSGRSQRAREAHRKFSPGDRI